MKGALPWVNYVNSFLENGFKNVLEIKVGQMVHEGFSGQSVLDCFLFDRLF